METTYGIISDIHATHPSKVIEAINILTQRLGAEKLILNGDLIGERSGFNPQEYLAIVLNAAVDTGVEVYAQEGSHEEIALAQPVFNHFSSTSGNFIDACQNPVVDGAGHRLIFLPGSDWHAGPARNNPYLIKEEPASVGSGFYPTEEGGLAHITNIADVAKYTRDPQRTIVVSHIPRAFDGPIEKAVDMAYFAERADGSLMPGVVVESMIKQQFGDSISDADIRLIAAQNGFTMKRENRGNQKLRAAFEQAGITKAINGHFHESAHRAHDRQCRPLPEGQYHDELFWMASYADEGKYGVLRVNDEGRVSYLNVNLGV